MTNPPRNISALSLELIAFFEAAGYIVTCEQTDSVYQWHLERDGAKLSSPPMMSNPNGIWDFTRGDTQAKEWI